MPMAWQNQSALTRIMELNVRISGSFTSGYDAGNYGNVGVRYETTRQRHIVL